jgi:hypothetical protein
MVASPNKTKPIDKFENNDEAPIIFRLFLLKDRRPQQHFASLPHNCNVATALPLLFQVSTPFPRLRFSIAITHRLFSDMTVSRCYGLALLVLVGPSGWKVSAFAPNR